MKHEEFIKLNKKQKLNLPYFEEYAIKSPSMALFIPLTRKNDGYTMCAFFVQKDGNWYRMMDYDCFRFVNYSDGKHQTILKGDFENGGVQFFLGGDYDCDYGGEFKYNK